MVSLDDGLNPFECSLVVGVDFRKQKPRRKMKNHGKMVMRQCSHAHTLTVGMYLNTSGAVFLISV